MPNNDRAKQFMPFDALRGLREAYRAKERIKVEKVYLTEAELAKLADKLTKLQKEMMIKIVHFSLDEYIETHGIVTKVNLDQRYVTIVKEKISFDNIVSLFCDELPDEEDYGI